MPLEQESYEKGWGQCRCCRVRQPERALSAGVCIDSAWCIRVGAPATAVIEVETVRRRLRIPNEGNLAPLPQPTLEHAGELVADLDSAKVAG